MKKYRINYSYVKPNGSVMPNQSTPWSYDRDESNTLWLEMKKQNCFANMKPEIVEEANTPIESTTMKKKPVVMPSEINMKKYCGYHRDVFEGWKKMPEATIYGKGYTVEFLRFSKRTIDLMCDALNGWYNIWTKFQCKYTDAKGTLTITVRKPEDADKLYNLVADITPMEFEHEGITPAVDVARTKLEAIISAILKVA